MAIIISFYLIYSVFETFGMFQISYKMKINFKKKNLKIVSDVLVG